MSQPTGIPINFSAILQAILITAIITGAGWVGGGLQDAKIQFTQIAYDIRNLTTAVMDIKDEWKQSKAEQKAINVEFEKRLTAVEYGLRTRKGQGQ